MIVSSIEGRIRFKDANIKNPEIAKTIENSLKDLDGIDDIRINPTIGSLLVNYDSEEIENEEILDALKNYIDIRKKPEEKSSQNLNFMDKAIDIAKKEFGNAKGKGSGQGSGMGSKASGKDGQGSNNLEDEGIGTIIGSRLIRYLVYSVIGVQGVKKGKNYIEGQGKGNKNR